MNSLENENDLASIETSYSSARAELLKLLEEYTEDVKRALELEARLESRGVALRNLLIAVALAGTVATLVVGLLTRNTHENFVASVELSSFVAMIGIIAGLAASVPIISIASRAQQKKFSHDIQFSAKILERIVSRAVQLVDHNSSRLDFTFEIRIAEAEAVLDRFKGRSSRETHTNSQYA
ncbi:hypothetical protein [Aliiroseovarius sp. PrR006]|uniref:hypothetical protein n=1 Tax=Aliiroseovarius sp. PrR006 TaxID=2706883 RepID=UPI0013D493EA|nr:hypothetical protein [Aliiroseovarius sp. PrR006]NDW53144.1 hypothetical protein [Aliiroseovarius sp. PrR006]